ncbi:MraY family glycosyltransferase [Methylophilaceae bacterium]|nr:MraY family glycosyltransferase [Methylophilaceae bacterium]
MGEQRVHEGEVPRIGGLLIYIALILFSYLNSDPSLSYPLSLILLSVLPMMVVTVKEDLFHNVGFKTRLVALIISSFLLLILVVESFPVVSHIPLISNLFHYPLFSFCFFMLCLVALANGCNFIDGMNGLFGFYLLGGLMSCLQLTYIINDTFMAQYILVYAIAMILFLMFNFPLGKIFMGDSGAYLMALLTGVWVIYFFSIHDFISSWNAGLILFYPIIEVVYSFIRKLMQKKSPFYPDREHLHLKVYDILNTALNKPRLSNNLTTIFLAVFWLTPPLIMPWVYDSQLLIVISLLVLSSAYIILNLVIPAKTAYVKG